MTQHVVLVRLFRALGLFVTANMGLRSVSSSSRRESEMGIAAGPDRHQTQEKLLEDFKNI